MIDPKSAPAGHAPTAGELADLEGVAILGREDLSPTGDGEEVVTNGMAMELMALIGGLKARRLEMGLTISDVSRRAGLTVVTISRLENHHARNPSLDTVFRYAMALDLLVTLGTEEIEPED